MGLFTKRITTVSATGSKKVIDWTAVIGTGVFICIVIMALSG